MCAWDRWDTTHINIVVLCSVYNCSVWLCLVQTHNTVQHGTADTQQDLVSSFPSSPAAPCPLCGGELITSFLEQEEAQVQQVTVLGVEGLAHSPWVPPFRPEHRLLPFQLLLHTSCFPACKSAVNMRSCRLDAHKLELFALNAQLLRFPCHACTLPHLLLANDVLQPRLQPVGAL